MKCKLSILIFHYQRLHRRIFHKLQPEIHKRNILQSLRDFHGSAQHTLNILKQKITVRSQIAWENARHLIAYYIPGKALKRDSRIHMTSTL
jgi:hypothetical protein